MSKVTKIFFEWHEKVSRVYTSHLVHCLTNRILHNTEVRIVYRNSKVVPTDDKMSQFCKGMQEDVSEADLENYLCNVSSTMYPLQSP